MQHRRYGDDMIKRSSSLWMSNVIIMLLYVLCSFDHLGNVYFGQEKNVKERSDGACNKRNARKKKNRKVFIIC